MADAQRGIAYLDAQIKKQANKAAINSDWPPQFSDDALALEFTKRHGDDLLYDLPISFAKAALGGDVSIPTLTGEVPLKIQRGTQTGTIYRVRGQGLPRLGEGGRGDLHVRVQVWTPQRLTDEQERLLRELEKVETTPSADEGAGRGFWHRIREALGGE